MTVGTDAPGPLAGLRVVELTHIMAGPTCGLMLADLGADVLKVERLPHGDDTRRMVPPTIDGESAAFMMMNRNKRGIALDLRRAEGREIVRRLAARADVLVENLRSGAMERMGLGYDALRADNPRLVYCSVSGYGRTGPYADRGGFDLVAQGMSGLMSITGEGPDRPPVKVGAPLTDITAGILAAMAVLAAHVHRLRTGEGQQVDTSLFEAGIVQTYWQSAICLATGVSPGPMGSAHPLSAPYQAFQTSDGWINVGAANQRNWLALVDAIGAPELARDPRFGDNAARVAHLAPLQEALAPLFRRHSTAEWLAALEAAGVPAGPVLSIAEMLADPQTRAREMVGEVRHARLGAVRTLGPPVKLSATPGALRRGAPLLGEHTREILLEHGYGESAVDALVASGIVLDGAPRGATAPGGKTA
jgi:crotonobetainyl-CoA:carnitine CoA-transferase CaiB-like acyl-CoA transferase